MYVLLPMPLLFFAGSDSTSLFNESDNRYVVLIYTACLLHANLSTKLEPEALLIAFENI